MIKDWDVILESKEWKLRIGVRNLIPPWVGATDNDLSLNEKSWTVVKGQGHGHSPTTIQMLRLLSSLSAIYIRGGYYDGHEETWLDSVSLIEGDHHEETMQRKIQKHHHEPLRKKKEQEKKKREQEEIEMLAAAGQLNNAQAALNQNNARPPSTNSQLDRQSSEELKRRQEEEERKTKEEEERLNAQRAQDEMESRRKEEELKELEKQKAEMEAKSHIEQLLKQEAETGGGDRLNSGISEQIKQEDERILEEHLKREQGISNSIDPNELKRAAKAAPRLVPLQDDNIVPDNEFAQVEEPAAPTVTGISSLQDQTSPEDLAGQIDKEHSQSRMGAQQDRLREEETRRMEEEEARKKQEEAARKKQEEEEARRRQEEEEAARKKQEEEARNRMIAEQIRRQKEMEEIEEIRKRAQAQEELRENTSGDAENSDQDFIADQDFDRTVDNSKKEEQKRGESRFERLRSRFLKGDKEAKSNKVFQGKCLAPYLNMFEGNGWGRPSLSSW